MAGDPARQAHEATKKRRPGLSEQGHVDASLRATQRSAQGDQQNLKQIVALRIAGPRIDQIRKARPKPLHPALPKPFGAVQADPEARRFYKLLMRFPWVQLDAASHLL